MNHLEYVYPVPFDVTKVNGTDIVIWLGTMIPTNDWSPAFDKNNNAVSMVYFKKEQDALAFKLQFGI
jgi:hypothetical protein